MHDARRTAVLSAALPPSHARPAFHRDGVSDVFGRNGRDGDQMLGHWPQGGPRRLTPQVVWRARQRRRTGACWGLGVSQSQAPPELIGRKRQVAATRPTSSGTYDFERTRITRWPRPRRNERNEMRSMREMREMQQKRRAINAWHEKRAILRRAVGQRSRETK